VIIGTAMIAPYLRCIPGSPRGPWGPTTDKLAGSALPYPPRWAPGRFLYWIALSIAPSRPELSRRRDVLRVRARQPFHEFGAVFLPERP
jgi:hypothetical protein